MAVPNWRTTIALHRVTLARMNRARAPGQCYDSFLSQLLDFWEATHGRRLAGGQAGEESGRDDKN